MAAHRVVACVAALAALYACALMVASTRQPDAVSPAGVTIATLVYVSFAVIAIVRGPPWLLAAVTRSVNAVEAYCDPAPVVFIEVAARQPRIRRGSGG